MSSTNSRIKKKSGVNLKKGGNPKTAIVHTLEVASINRTTQDIETWRTAIQAAESVYSPNRLGLYNLYHDLLLDGMLSAALEKREYNITNSELIFVDANNVEVPEVTALTQQSYFDEALFEMFHTATWGYTLLELLWPYYGSDITEGRTVLVNRPHVKPELGIVTRETYDDRGIDYKTSDAAKFAAWFGKEKDLGVLMGVAQYVIYKRGNFGDWAQYAEIFGMPFRHGKYTDPETKSILTDALENASSAGWMVTPEDANIETQEANGVGSGNLYKMLKAACDEEILVKILGNTMTTKATSGSGYAQSKTHAESEKGVFANDKKRVLQYLNGQVKRVLINLGYPVEGGRWQWKKEENLSKKERIEIDLKIKKEGIPIADDYFYETYGIPKPENYDQLKADQVSRNKTQEKPEDTEGQTESGINKKTKKEKTELVDLSAEERGLLTRIMDFFGLAQRRNDAGQTVELADSLTDAVETFLQAAYNGLLSGAMVHLPLYEATAEKLFGAVKKGFGTPTLDFGSADNTVLRKLRENIYAFSGAKSLRHLKKINTLRFDDKGKLKTWARFRNDVQKTVAEYNEHHLRTEMDTADAAAQMAAKWGDYWEQRDVLKYLTYVTMGDSKVRPAHKKLHGFTAAIDDPIWDKIFPPSDFGCRCTTKQASKMPKHNPTVDDETIKQAVGENFRNNVGKTGKVFDDTHPHFKETDVQSLAAVENYGMPPMAKHYTGKNLKKLPTAEGKDRLLPVVANIDQKDMFGTAVKGQLSHKYADTAKEILLRPDEVWSSNNQYTYIKYYQNAPIAITADETGKLTAIEELKLKDDNKRKGILLFR